MKPVLNILAVLSILSTASACPIHQGFVANGLVRDSAHLIPVCGSVPDSLKTLPAGIKWQEIYIYSNTSMNRTKLVTLTASIRGQGFRQDKYTKNGVLESYTFLRGNQGVVVSVVPFKSTYLLTIRGN